MKLARSYEMLNAGYDAARAALSIVPAKIAFFDEGNRSFRAAIAAPSSRSLLFSYPISLFDENRLTQIGFDDSDRMHLLRQSPVEPFPGRGLGFAEASGIPFAKATRRADSATEPVWLDFGIVTGPEFVDIFADALARYFATWTSKKT